MTSTTNAPEPIAAGWDPLQMYYDCHRRIERILHDVLDVAEEARGGRLTPSQQEILDRSLRYFRGATAIHSADEEVSLFPRIRTAGEPLAEGVEAILAGLEQEHHTVEEGHREMEYLGRAWCIEGQLSEEKADVFVRLLRKLCTFYHAHISVEDTVIFPLASRLLDKSDLAEIWEEMAQRRGMDPRVPVTFSRCASRRAERSATPDSHPQVPTLPTAALPAV